MDPNATLVAILEHIDSRDRDEALHAINDLADWIEYGGFLPTNIQTTDSGLLVTKNGGAR
jgi:hypothetical protein